MLLNPDPQPGPDEPTSKYTGHNPVYAGDQWAGCLQVGTYGLGAPASGTLTIEEGCGCPSEPTSLTESTAATHASSSAPTPAADQSDGDYYSDSSALIQAAIAQRGVFQLTWKGKGVKKYWEGGQYVVPAGTMFVGNMADVTLKFSPSIVTNPLTLIQLVRITAVDNKTNQRVPVTQSTKPEDYPDLEDQLRKPWELPAITTSDGWRVDVFPRTVLNGSPDYECQGPVEPPGSQQLKDAPGFWGIIPKKYDPDSLRWEFETYAVCEGPDGKLQVIAGLAWGFQLGTVKIEPLGWALPHASQDIHVPRQALALNGPSASFLAAMQKFNAHFHTAFSVE